MDIVQSNINWDTKVYLWGCGKYGMLQAMFLEENGYMIEAFIDNDSNKADKIIINNIVCKSPSDVQLTGKELCIICIRMASFDELNAQAQKKGFAMVLKADFDQLDAYANGLEDKLFLEKIWQIKQGYKIDWNNPKTFNEKLQWLKLYDRRAEYSQMVDKYEAKKYVADRIGVQYIVPTLGVWDSAEEIDFDILPDQFVLKCTHDSGGVLICKDKSTIDVDSVRKKLNENLYTDYYLTLREWPYKNIKPRVIAEKYIEDFADGELRDYKLYTFNGKVKYMLLASNRQSDMEELAFDYFDSEGNHLDLTNHWHPNAKTIPHLPQNYKKMIELAENLANGIPHIRVDFYEANGAIYFGELTFFDMGGFLKIHPDDWDIEWGELIDLPKEKRE